MERIYIGNLPYEAQEQNLIDLFNGYNVKNIEIPAHRESGRAKGFCYVEISKEEVKKKANLI